MTRRVWIAAGVLLSVLAVSTAAVPAEPSRFEKYFDQAEALQGFTVRSDVSIGDDRNNNGVPDHEELDLDGDRVSKARAIPWDAFPLNSSEWRDTDGDSVGDNADPDKDGDGWTDEEERKAGADLLDKLSFPVK
jgi:hypothetical protein